MDNPTADKIWLSSPHMGGREQHYLQQAFDANWIAPLGPHVDGFEQDISRFTGIPYVAALSSGTAAMHLALQLQGVGPGDVVFVQSFTFSATVNPILYQGAIPYFIESEPGTWNMDADHLAEAIEQVSTGNLSIQWDMLSPEVQQRVPWLKEHLAGEKPFRPSAIIPVHLYGMPANMITIRQVAAKYGLPIIEDAAEALGSTLDGTACGAFGQMAVFSFNGNKIITTGGGGALAGYEETDIAKARFLSTQARDNAPHYEHSHIGFNYRLSNVAAAIGRGQMEVLADRVAQRRDNFQYYHEALAGLAGVRFQQEPDQRFFSNRWLTTLTIHPEENGGITREDVRLALAADNIDSRPLWKPMHLQPVFSGLPVNDEGLSGYLFEHGLCLPSGSNLTKQELDRVIRVIKKVFA